MASISLLYLHGLGSSGHSDTGQYLRRHYAGRCALQCPSYRPQFFHESVTRIDAWLRAALAAGPVAVLGSSMGGWHALHALARHPRLHVLALNPVLDPSVLGQGQPRDDVDQRSGEALPWPELIAANFPSAPIDTLPVERLRVMIGAADDVVPPAPTLEHCQARGISHRVYDWGHRAELGADFAAEIDGLLERAAG